MENKSIGNGTLIRFNGEETTWRVIFLSNSVYRMIDTSSDGFKFRDMTFDEMTEAELNGTITVPEDQEIRVLDKSELTPEALELFKKKQAFVNEMAEVYGDDYSIFPTKKKKPFFEKKLEEYGFSKSTGYRTLLFWLQSGKQEYSLADKRLTNKKKRAEYHYNFKTGRKASREQGIIKDDYCREAFEYGLSIYKRHRTATVVYCFAKLTAKYYSKEENGSVELFAPDERPTLSQFRNHIKKSLTPEEAEIIKTSIAEYRNDKRLLFGTSRYEATRPGMILEADAVETDLYVVSSIDPTKLVGRPVVYMLVDIYSHCIVAASVSFENNSNLALTNLMINFFLDKGRVACNSNVIIDESLWPSQFIPGTIRCDRGSDFKSKNFEEICAAFGISRQLCTGATGSMKGTIEQLFREFHLMFATEFERKGYIQKRYDSNHKKEALLTINEVSQLVILFILYHNAHNIMSTKLTRDMIKEGVSKKPIDIWNYGIKHKGSMPPIMESKADEAFFNLLPEDNASISRGGINYRGLCYVPFGDNDLLAKVKLSEANAGKRDTDGKKKNEIAIRFDPRSVNFLYYIKSGKVMKLALNKEKCGSYANLTWNEYQEYYDIQNERDIELEDENLRLRVERERALESISKSVDRTVDVPDSKNMRETRKVEKEMVNFNGAVSQYINGANEVTEEAVNYHTAKSLKDLIPGNPGGISVTSPSETVTTETPIDKAGEDDKYANTLFSDKVPDCFKRKH